MVNTAANSAPHTRTVVTGYRPALAGRQCAAAFIDIILMSAAATGAGLAARNIALGVLVAVECVIVYMVGEGARGVTPGKLMLGIRTVRAESQRDPRAGILPGGGRVILKYLVLAGSALLALLGLVATVLSPLFSRGELRQGWADRAAGLVEVDIHQRVIGTITVRDPQDARYHEVRRSEAMRHVDDSSESLDIRVTPDTPAAPEPAMTYRAPAAPVQAVPSVPAPIAPSAPTTPPVPGRAASGQAGVPVPPAMSAAAAVPTPPASQHGGPRISIYFEDGSRQPLVIPSTVVLGRKPALQQPGDATLAVPDHTGTVSRSHARLEITAAHLWITDLGSTNGTRVIAEDGEETTLQPHVRHAIRSGARITLGDMGCSIITAKSRGRRS
ncbi:FHA domain-containing protein [Bifidobacterium saguinibicoloris]|uniref:FHA domain-containing protein n=1 Tax=Bifidobacterium saguinibicoloris TaxID=2834433 RepID=UPI001C591E60|nr:FHA domain-containing protein [Bifidobacterium saguinibicoloris]MBW3081127.1 FHA domain-containing protein [Bifidobacterium saguinibicoloris]